MGEIEWDEVVETKRRVRMLVDGRGSPSAPAAAVWAPGFRDATIDDLRRACEAAGLVVETRERAAADLAGRTNLREAYQRLADEQDACLDALSEHVSPDGTVTTPRMVRPSSLLAGIRSLQGRLRDARSDLREHDAELEAANARAEKALSILNAMPGDDIVSAASHMMDVRRRQSEDREAMRYGLSTIINESFGPQPVMTHEELLSFLEDKIRERTRDLALIARAVAANIDVRVAEEQGGGFLVAAHRAGEDEDVERNVPAAEVPAELARMLTEVGA